MRLSPIPIECQLSAKLNGSSQSLVVSESVSSSKSRKAGWVCQFGAILKSEAYERQAGRPNPPVSQRRSSQEVILSYLVSPTPSFKKSPSLPSDNKPACAPLMSFLATRHFCPSRRATGLPAMFACVQRFHRCRASLPAGYLKWPFCPVPLRWRSKKC